MLDAVSVLRRHRAAVLASNDAVAWVVAVVGFTFVRYLLDGTPGQLQPVPWREALVVGLCAAFLQGLLGLTVRLHHGRSMTGSLDEMLALGPVTGVVGLLMTAGNLLIGRPVPGSVPAAGACIALVIMAWYRAAYRRWCESRYALRGDPRTADPAEPRKVIVFGAGEAGRQLVTSMVREPWSGWQPVAMLDDDPTTRYRRFRGIPMSGGRDRIAQVAQATSAEVLVIAIPSATSEIIRPINEAAQDAGLDVKVLPGVDDLFGRRSVAISDVRDINVTDLLGRHQIDTDIESIAGYLTDKRVLVTGAGGSIGSELCRQIARFSPAELIMLDRDESALHAVQLSIYGKAMLDSDDVVLGDIRDATYIDAMFAHRKPQVVFHAAALKHLPMLEQYPGEAIKTNVWGSLTVLEAARAHGVERFVNISTDKAANPCSVLGYSKRLAEGLTAAVAENAAGTYLSVRFGNVLGSRGSVLTAFTSQISNGGPVTVTDPDVTRYFMTIQEAVQLVIQAAAIGRDGEALVLDMGEPVSIDSVARQLIEMSGEDIDIVYTGLRHGEKMHEELFEEGEIDVRPIHPRVSHTAVPAFDPREARALDPWDPHDKVVRSVRKAAGVLKTPATPRVEVATGQRRSA